MNTATLLQGTERVLRERGRCRRKLTFDGKVDVLGALAVADSQEPTVWEDLAGTDEARWVHDHRDLVAAARALARVVAPVFAADVEGQPVRWLVGLLGDWCDTASDVEVYSLLGRAARLAGPILVSDLHRADMAEVDDPERGHIAFLMLDEPRLVDGRVSAIVQTLGTYDPFRFTCPLDATARLIPRTAVAS